LFHPYISPLFENRYDAGRQLAAKLTDYKGKSALVLAVPNGGVPIASEIAKTIDAELDIVVVRKLPMPLHPEAGFGAVADDGSFVFNEEMVAQHGITQQQINDQVALVTAQVRQRTLLYRKDRSFSLIRGKAVILVDDGLASGYTMLAAVQSMSRRHPGEIVVAVPAASLIAVERVSKVAVVRTVAVGAGSRFAISEYYRHWHDVPDSDVNRILDEQRGLWLRRPLKP
jgi:putative phosphoribosyl transferase